MKGRRVLEGCGAVTGLLGAALLAMNDAYSGWGFLAFLASNLFWIAFAIRTDAWGLVVMQTGFVGTSLLGIYRWLV